jgi:hypothetical protein
MSQDDKPRLRGRWFTFKGWRDELLRIGNDKWEKELRE